LFIVYCLLFIAANKLASPPGFGVVELNILIEQAIDLADTALYQAKSSGRNKVGLVNPL
jgi:GGDEF domain-containing protein